MDNPKIYVADKETLDKVYNLLATEPVYGFIEHNAILAPGERIEYIGMNKDFKPINVTMGGGFSLNGWADFPWLRANKPYMVRSDGTPAYRLKETDYTKREDGTDSDVANTGYDGGAFAWAMKIYKREYMTGDDRVVLFRFEKADGFEPVGFIDPDGNELEGAWIPMFFGSIVGTKMTSISGVQPEYGNTTAAQKTAIDAVGKRAHFFGGSLLNTLIDLMIMFARTTDLQTAYGKGNCDGHDASLTPTNGVKRNAVIGGGQFFGTDDGKTLNKVFHSIILTGGNIYCRDPYTLVVKGRFKVSPNYKYDLTGATYQDTGIDVPAPEASNAVYPHKYQTVPGFGHLPVYPYNGSTSLGGCDGFYLSTSQATITAVAVRFGHCSDRFFAGPRSMPVHNTATLAYWSTGSALLLLPPVGVTV